MPGDCSISSFCITLKHFHFFFLRKINRKCARSTVGFAVSLDFYVSSKDGDVISDGFFRLFEEGGILPLMRFLRLLEELNAQLAVFILL